MCISMAFDIILFVIYFEVLVEMGHLNGLDINNIYRNINVALCRILLSIEKLLLALITSLQFDINVLHIF